MSEENVLKKEKPTTSFEEQNPLLHRYENEADSLSSTDEGSLSESSPGEPDYEQSYTQELSVRTHAFHP